MDTTIGSVGSISSVGPLRPQTIFPLETDKAPAGPESFGEMLKGAINSVNAQMTDADDKLQRLATGEIKDVHEVTLALQKAGLSLDLVVAIRDRALEAYQTIMRMAI